MPNLNSKDKQTYWTQRAEQRLINAENLTSDMLKNLRTNYEATIKSLEKEINAFYGKYATETGLDLTEVRKRLNPKELKDFKTQLKKYYDEVKRLGGYAPDTKEYLRELSAKAYISRLEELQAQMRWQVENLYRTQQLKLFDVLSKGYEDTYYKSTFDMQQGIGFAYSFNTLDDRKVRLAVTQKWQGSNFSDRIWADKARLIDALNTTIPQGIALGQNPRKVAQTIAKSMNTRYSNAERLARTEMNHICNESARQAYNEVPEVLQEYKIVATLDNRTSEICQDNDNKVYKMSEWEEGITAPPFHPNSSDKYTEIYTKDGWKLFKDCTDDDLYFSINPETMIPEWLKAVQRISYRFTGNLIEFTNTNFNKRVTPNHQMVMKYNKKDGANKLRFVTAEKCPKYNNSIPRGINWIGQDVKIAKLGNYEIPIDLYLKFMVWWLADGSCSQVSNNSYRGNIAQETHNKLMYETLQEMPFNISNSGDKLYFSDYSVCKELYQYGKCNEKYIPEFIKTLTPDLIKIFLEGYTITDGHKKKTKQWKGGKFKDEITFFTTSKKLADDLGELILKAGGRPSFSIKKSKGIPVKHHNGTYIGNFDVWVIRWCNNTWTNIESLQRNLIPYDDYVYCVELPKYHTLLIRRNGKVCWTGNCRTTTIPYFPEMDTAEYTRIATDYSTGQAYYVPSSMSYREWRLSLTENQEKAFIADKKIREQHSQDKKQLSEYRKLQTYANKNGKSELFEGMPRSLNEYQTLKYTEPEKYEILKENARIIRSEMK